MDDIRKLETSIGIVQSTVQNGIYQEVAFKAEPNWCSNLPHYLSLSPALCLSVCASQTVRGSLLSEYNLAFKQLDSVWTDINPIFQLYEIVPTKPTEFPAESLSPPLPPLYHLTKF
jgi:hypothetical protein